MQTTMNTSTHRTPKRGQHIAGPLSQTDYTIVSVGARGTVGLAKGTGGLAPNQWRIRVMPSNEAAASVMAFRFAEGGCWKNPCPGNCRYSLVTSDEAVKDLALAIGKAAITGGPTTRGRVASARKQAQSLIDARVAAHEDEEL